MACQSVRSDFSKYSANSNPPHTPFVIQLALYLFLLAALMEDKLSFTRQWQPGG